MTMYHIFLCLDYMTTYHIATKTGDFPESSTDANVFVQIFGEGGDTGKIWTCSTFDHLNTAMSNTCFHRFSPMIGFARVVWPESWVIEIKTSQAVIEISFMPVILSQETKNLPRHTMIFVLFLQGKSCWIWWVELEIYSSRTTKTCSLCKPQMLVP